MAQFDIKKDGLKIIQAAAYILGTAIFAFNITAFRISQGANYFKDNNQYWIAIGASLIVLGLIIRHWKKL